MLASRIAIPGSERVIVGPEAFFTEPSEAGSYLADLGVSPLEPAFAFETGKDDILRSWHLVYPQV